MHGTTVFFDLETGGTEEKHPVIQLAAVAVRDWKEVDALECKVSFQEKECDPEALALNGYDRAVWDAKAVMPMVAASNFRTFLEKHADLTLVSARTGRPYRAARMAGHNVVAFDIPRLRTFMDRARIGWWPGCWWYPLDTYQRAIWLFAEQGLPPPADYKLGTLAAHFSIPSQGAAHDALADVRTTVLVAKAIIHGETPADV